MRHKLIVIVKYVIKKYEKEIENKLQYLNLYFKSYASISSNLKTEFVLFKFYYHQTNFLNQNLRTYQYVILETETKIKIAYFM